MTGSTALTVPDSPYQSGVCSSSKQYKGSTPQGQQLPVSSPSPDGTLTRTAMPSEASPDSSHTKQETPPHFASQIGPRAGTFQHVT